MSVTLTPYSRARSREGLEGVSWKGELGLELWVLCVEVASVGQADSLLLVQGRAFPSQA